jgi:hypothetical protein
MREVNKKRGARILGSRTRLYDAGTCVSCSSQSWLLGTRGTTNVRLVRYTHTYTANMYYSMLCAIMVY